MQLILLLLITVSILTFLSGAIVFLGSSKGSRMRSAWFFLAAIFATAWISSVLVFLTASPNMADTINWHVQWTFVSAILIDVSFLGYIAWQEKYGQAITIFFAVVGLAISTLIFINPSYLYSGVNLARAGNTVDLGITPLSITYLAFFSCIVPAIVLTLFKQFAKTKSSRKRSGDFTIMVSFGASSLLTLIANLILPVMGNWSLIWLGPLALSATIIAFYYTILRYKALNLSSIWLKMFSYIVIITSLAIIYMVIFSIIFAALFRGSTPSTEVIILNFIMILIFLALMPAMNQLSIFIRSLISNQNGTPKKEA